MKLFLDRSLLALVLGLIVYNALAFGGVRLIDQAGSMVVMVVALGLSAVRLVAGREPPRTGGFGGLMILAFLAYAVARHLYAETEYASRHELIDVALGVATFFLVLNAVDRPRDATWVIGVLLTVSAGLALYGIYQHATGIDQVWTSVRPASYHGRGSGTFVNPNHLGGFLEMVLPLGIALTLMVRKSWPARITWGYCVLVVIAGIVFTFSRGAWVSASLGLGALLVWMVLARRRSLGWALIILLVVGVLVGGASTTLLMRQRSELTEKELDTWRKSTRFLIWHAAYAAWQANPWWGIGAHHFQYRYFAHRDPWLQTNPVRAHNDYLNTLCDYGLVGAALALAATAGVFWVTGRTLLRRPGDATRAEPATDEKGLVAAAAAGLLALAVHSLFDFNLHLRANLLLALLLAGLVARFAAAGNPSRRRRASSVAFAARWGMATLLVVAAICLGRETPRIWREATALRAFRSAEWGTEAARDALLRAAAIEPGNPETLIRLGDHFRQRSLLGEDDHVRQGEEAMRWYRRAMQETPANPWPVMRLGMCLHWLGQHDEATEQFERMIALDPNSQYTRGMMGWHYFQLEDYARAKEWFHRARFTPHFNDPVTLSYEKLLAEREREVAARSRAAPPPVR